MNKVYFIGVIEALHELKHAKSGLAIMDILVKETSKFKEDVVEEFRPITLFGSLAEKFDSPQFLGKSVFVLATLSSKAWNTQDGATKYPLKLIGSEVKIFDVIEENKVNKEQVELATSPPADLFNEKEDNYEDVPF